MPTRGEIVSLTVERPAVGGPMIARLDGRIVLVSGAIPGERVRARIDRATKSVLFASATAIDEASPDRRPAFDDPMCGGCSYSHIAYARQLQIKSEVVADAFARVGRMPLQASIPVAASQERGYRMRARLHVRNGRMGFMREGSHDVCDPRPSGQLLPETCDALDRLAASVRSVGDIINGVELTENIPATERVARVDTNQPLDARVRESFASIDGFTPGPYVSDLVRVGDHTITLRRHVLAFFQGNRYLLADLVSHVAAQIPVGERVLDLYAGAGLFSVAAARVRDAHVEAVEGDRWGVDDLRANASVVSGVHNVVVHHGDVESFLTTDQAATTIVVDPPRTGLSTEALAGLLRTKARRIVYVSCDPATLARDARGLVDAGYRMDPPSAFDMFPNTPHVETVAVFQR